MSNNIIFNLFTLRLAMHLVLDNINDNLINEDMLSDHCISTKASDILYLFIYFTS